VLDYEMADKVNEAAPASKESIEAGYFIKIGLQITEKILYGTFSIKKIGYENTRRDGRNLRKKSQI
jgi:hypothetical protein